MSNAMVRPRTRRAQNSLVHQPRRRQAWNGLSAQEILARHPAGKTPLLKVLELLIGLFNQQHSARHKEVSFKTRQERAEFLRRFFRDLKRKAGFNTLPDPRNLGDRHVRAIVTLWQQEKLAPATIQTYLQPARTFSSISLTAGRGGMDKFRALRYLVVAAETGSFSAAARRLQVSSTAVLKPRES